MVEALLQLLRSGPSLFARVPGEARRVVLLAGPSTRPFESPDRSLIHLRWMAILGMTLTSVVGHQLAPRIDLAPILIIIGAIFFSNLFWLALCRGEPQDSGRFTREQLIGDMLALSVLLWFSGGLWNPFAVFLTFHIVLAGLLCTLGTTLVIAGLTVMATTVLSWAEPLPLADGPLPANVLQRYAAFTSLILVIAFLAFAVLVQTRLIDRFRSTSAQVEKLAMLGRLVGAMSHELNTPLATIVIAANEILEMGEDEDKNTKARLTETIASEARRASSVITLMRGQIRSDQLEEVLDLGAFVRRLVPEELARLGFQGQVEVRAPEAPVTVRVIPAGLTQLLHNVLMNAVQATHANAQEREVKPEIAVSVVPREGCLELAIEDNGHGFAPEILARLGEPFQTTKAREGGLGLGLYLSGLLAEQLGAELRVENSEEGARVTLVLPVGDAEGLKEQGRRGGLTAGQGSLEGDW